MKDINSTTKRKPAHLLRLSERIAGMTGSVSVDDIVYMLRKFPGGETEHFLLEKGVHEFAITEVKHYLAAIKRAKM